MSDDRGWLEPAVAAQPSKVIGDVVGFDRIHGLDAIGNKGRDEIAKIPTVRFEGRGREASLDADVGQKFTNRLVEAGAIHHHG